jgi:hypothetical protein
VNTVAAVTVTMIVLALAGALPTAVLVGPRLVALVACPLAGAVLCALAGASCLAFPGTLLTWFITWSAVAALCSAAALYSAANLLRRHGVPPWTGQGARLRRHLRQECRPAALLAAGALVAAVAWSLRTLRVPNVGFDTRAIWLLHAHWLSQGHTFALAALRNPFNAVSHPSYPPLISSVMALSWRVSGSDTDRVAVVLVAALNACALFVAGWGVVEAARRSAARTHVSPRDEVPHLVLGGFLAVFVVLVAGGVLGTFGTNGYADPLWSLAAVAAVIYGLVLPPTGSDLGLVAIVLGVAGLSKVEGTAIALVLVVAVSLRCIVQRDRPGGVRRPAIAMGAGMLALAGWPLLTLFLGVPKDAVVTGTRDGSLWLRTRATFDAAAPHLDVVALAAVIALAGMVLLRHRRSRFGLGNDLWAWAILAVAVVVLGGAYVFGPGDVELWLATSVNRTTIFVALLGWWIVAMWALCGVAGAFE